MHPSESPLAPPRGKHLSSELSSGKLVQFSWGKPDVVPVQGGGGGGGVVRDHDRFVTDPLDR